jgi:hypothetical protein
VSELYELGALTLTVAGLVLAGVALAMGFRVARRRLASNPSAPTDIGSVEGVVYGLFGLLLAFTFAFVVDRAEVRRELVVEEANAIETSFLRSAVAPSPEREALEQLHRRYLKARVAYVEAGGEGARVRALEEADALQGELWSKAVSVAISNPPSPLYPLLLAAQNDMFDVRSRRTRSFRARLPDAVVLFLLVTTVLTALVVGYSLGLRRAWHPTLSVAFLMLMAVVLYLILDIDRPFRGLIRTPETAVLSLAERLGVPR